MPYTKKPKTQHSKKDKDETKTIQNPPRLPNEAERAILEREMEKERRRRDRAVKNERTRREGRETKPHTPTPRRNRKDIMKELT